MVSFRNWLHPVEMPAKTPSSEQQFRGRMSYQCLTEAAGRGSPALMTYLTLWHHGSDSFDVPLDDQTCRKSSLSKHQRQRGLRLLCEEPSLAVGAIKVGATAMARAIDPYQGTGTFFAGGMSFRSLVEAFRCSRGKTLAIYLAAHHAYTLSRRQGPIHLGQAIRESLGTKKSSWNRGIGALELSGLLQFAERRQGASPLVIPLDPWAAGCTKQQLAPQVAPQDIPPSPPTVAPARRRECSDPYAVKKADALAAIRVFEAGG